MVKVPLKISYIPVIPSEWSEISKDLNFFNMLSVDYQHWQTDKPPKPYRHALITLIKLSTIARETTMGYLRRMREQGELERLMFDSGGFQMFRDPSFTIERLIRDNLRLYQKHDWADAYVMPDRPPLPSDPYPIMQTKVESTINATKQLFEQLPAYIQKRCVPVFHVRNETDIDYQYKHYKYIIETSNLCCYAIPGTRKKLDYKNMKLMHSLVKTVGPDVKVHALGVASPHAVYCMEQIGISSYDAVSPIFIAGTGMVQTFQASIDFSDRKPDLSVSREEMEQFRQESGHRCPFCDNLDKLYTKYRYRRLHNLIVFDEFSWFHRNTTMDKFSDMAPDMYEALSQVLESNGQLALF